MRASEAFIAFGILLVIIGGTYVLSYTLETTSVVSNEIRPSAIQQKYDWFQTQKGAIEASIANIQNLHKQAVEMKKMYGDTPYKEWDRVDKMQYNNVITNLQGQLANYNALVSQYMVAMNEWNREFANFGSWPTTGPSKGDFDQFNVKFPDLTELGGV